MAPEHLRGVASAAEGLTPRFYLVLVNFILNSHMELTVTIADGGSLG